MIAYIKRFDVWLGKTLFHTPIIGLCHALNCTQYQLNRWLWFIWCFYISSYFYIVEGKISIMWIFTVTNFLFALLKSPHAKTLNSLFMRCFLLATIPVVIYQYMFIKETHLELMGLVFLFAEYASTIETLPPKKMDQKYEKFSINT